MARPAPVTVLDSNALVALLTGAAGMAEAGRLLTARTPVCMSAANVAEVYDVLVRSVGVSEDELRRSVDPLIGTTIAVVPVSGPIARRAGLLRARHYRRRAQALSLADCLLLATASPGDRVATSDRVVLRAAAAEGIQTVPLPDSRGRTPR